jgi:NNP family nitrate/nitrite transporter-like MFS transporter
MPIIFSAIVGFGYAPHMAWRYAMIVPAVMMWIVAYLYYRYTKDTPAGNYSEIGYPVAANGSTGASRSTDWSVLADWRVAALTMAYGMCFGMEITFDNVASLHFVDTFHLSQHSAGFWAGTFGFMNLFARALGGIFSDRAGLRWGMRGKGSLLAAALLLEGLGLIAFAHAPSFPIAIAFMLTFALFLKMANGAVYGIVPFINEKNVGLISGVVGAGGNLGGMLFGFLFKSESITYGQAFTYIGLTVVVIAAIVSVTRFRKEPAASVPERAAPATA